MKSIYAIILAILTGLCLNAQSSRPKNTEFPIQIEPSSRSITIPPKIYGHLSSIIIYKNLLVSIEPYNDTIFSVFKLPSCKYLGCFGINGRGPDEYFRPDARNAVATNNGVLLKDLSDRFIFTDLNNYLENRTFRTRVIKVPGELEALNNGFLLNDSIVCGMPYVGGRENKPYVKFDMNTKKVEYFGYWPTLYKGVKDKANWILYSGRSRVKPDRSMFVTFMFYVRMFRIYRCSGELYQEVILETPQKLIENGELRPYPKQFYTCIRVTNDLILALNTACSGPEMPKTNPTLEIWNWNGKPVAKVLLDRPISQFDIENEGKLLYCIEWNTMDKIFVYNLSEVLK